MCTILLCIYFSRILDNTGSADIGRYLHNWLGSSAFKMGMTLATFHQPGECALLKGLVKVYDGMGQLSPYHVFEYVYIYFMEARRLVWFKIV